MEMQNDLTVIPGGLTSVLQPLDVSVNKPCKDSIKKLYTQWMAEGIQELMSIRKIRRPSTEMTCEWILRVWNMVLMKITTQSFLKIGIRTTLHRSEDDMLWAGHENVDS
jgi:hypothetical protein